MDCQLFLVNIILSVYTSIATDQPALYFSLVVSNISTINTSGIVSAVNRTLKLINNDVAILPGYHLQYTKVLDTQYVSKMLRLHAV